MSGGIRPSDVVGPVLVVGDEPRVGELLHFLRRHSQKGVEDLLAIGAVDLFDEGVLHGLARLDVEPGKPVPVAPVDKDLGPSVPGRCRAGAPGDARSAASSWSSTRTTRGAGIDVPTSMASPSRLPSSSTFSVRNRRPPYRASCMTSSAQISLSGSGATRDRRMRGGTRRPSPPRQVRAEGVIHAVDPCVIPTSARPAKPAISPEVSTDSSAAPSPCAGMRRAVAASGDRSNRAPRASACEPYRELIVEAVGRGRNAMAIWQDRVDAHGFPAPYPSVRRFVSKLRQRPAAPGPGGHHDGAGASSAGRLRRRADGP